MASPGSEAAAAAAVCCMCGDHGLPRELFRCCLCRFRLQHRYCSELYPAVTAPYRRCNWCLRVGAGGGGSPAKLPMEAAAARKRRMATTAGEMESCEEPDGGESSWRSCGGECSRSVFTAVPGKPVKKPKLAVDGERSVPPAPEAAATKGRRKQTQAAAGKAPPARFRVKVRRYRLLAEVISC